MTEHRIEPSKVTKPIQLLAAWLVGLILVNGSFLGAAISIASPEWVRVILVVASILNVPVFLFCLFLLQTKFRPEMQEDSYYSKYLEANTGKMISARAFEVHEHSLRAELAEHNKLYLTLMSGLEGTVKELASQLELVTAKSSTESDKTIVMQQVSEIIDRSSRAIEVAKQDAIKTSFSVEINDLLPDYLQIRNELKINKITINKTFGSTSKDPEVPKQKIISFGPKVPIDKLKTIVLALQKYGFDRISYADIGITESSIFIGSYIYRSPGMEQAVRIDQDILGILQSPDATLEELIDEIEDAAHFARTG